ncbi:MAG: hypothetical protein HZA16_01850 [Nitrospirae bacterium]|nr:hypothetical protein [Nitrospirota bacterium]
MKDPHIVWHERLVTTQERNRLNKHRSGVVIGTEKMNVERSVQSVLDLLGRKEFILLI